MHLTTENISKTVYRNNTTTLTVGLPHWHLGQLIIYNKKTTDYVTTCDRSVDRL